MEFRKGILFIRLKGDLNKDTIKGIIDNNDIILGVNPLYKKGIVKTYEIGLPT